MSVREVADNIINECEKIIVGKRDKIRLVVMAILTSGHVLLNDLPGSGKTTLVKTLSIALGLDFKRVQFVSDMLPSDLVGMNIFNQKTGDFELREGPVMTNILLADEINRAIPRTQSALLEAMEEHQVTIDGKTISLPSPFIVLATENPVEKQSTFALPQAELDRFLISLSLGYPEKDEERVMLKKVGDGIPFEKVNTVFSLDMFETIKEEIRNIYVSDDVLSYIVSIVDQTRKDERIKIAASPRASRSLYQSAKTWAAMDGRNYVRPDDVASLAHAVLSHRLVLENSARLSSLDVDSLIDQILKSVEPGPVLEK